MKRMCWRKKANSFITAVQLNIDTAGLAYKKWGGDQFAKQGDWLVDNGGDVYTIDASTFESTYRKKSAGVYFKAATVWAEVALTAGCVDTKEGKSHFAAGDYLVSNDEAGADCYCVEAEQFENMYERI